MSGAYEMCAKRVIERASSVAVCVHVCVRALCSVSLSLTLTVSVSAADTLTTCYTGTRYSGLLAITDDPLCFWYFTANFISYTG